MASRPRRENPELNVTSFCDIITVTIVALFMVLVIVIDLSMRTPKVRPVPLALATTNTPVFIECRANQIYPIDRNEISEVIRTASVQIRSLALSGDPEKVQEAMTMDVGNKFYRLDNSFMMMGIIALIPRAGVPGFPPPEDSAADHPFRRLLNSLNTNAHYLVYLVRDDSFEAFRKARDFGARLGFLTGWEYIARDEPLTFEGIFSRVKAE
ncbi:MAG: hypothetical protein NZ740_02240 [Kiritimatiellae bacterium]|nr:hypothetical protein [Kiritimatiellia bacterium]MDW8457911.1 hypothetical protein [Verrucomicrobiota bacterium]